MAERIGKKGPKCAITSRGLRKELLQADLAGRGPDVRVMKCGVWINKRGSPVMTAALNDFFTEVDHFRKAVGKWLAAKFKENPGELLLLAAGQYWPEDPSEREFKAQTAPAINLAPLEIDGDVAVSAYPCPDCGQAMIVWKYNRSEVKDRKGDLKDFYLFRCSDYSAKDEKCGASLRANLVERVNELGEKETVFETGGFKAQNLYGQLYKWFVTKKEFPENPKAHQLMPAFRAFVGASVCNDWAGVLAAFFARLLSQKNELLMIHAKNRKLFQENQAEGKNSASQFSEALPETIDEPEKYNVFIAKYNIWVNQQNQRRQAAELSKLELLGRLKGLPGFPGTVSQKPPQLKAWDDLIELCQSYLPGAEAFWQKAKGEEWREFCHQYGPREVNGKIFPQKNRRIRRMVEKTTHWLELGISAGEIFKRSREHYEKEIQQKTIHFENTNSDEHGRCPDSANLRSAVDLVRVFAMVLLAQFERGTEESAHHQQKFNQLSAEVKGTAQRKETTNQSYTVMGFSVNPPKVNTFSQGGALVFKVSPEGKIKWFLIFNPRSDGDIPRVAKPGEKTDFWGYDHNGKKLPLKFDPEQSGALMIPLAFSKHQGQEFFWNSDLSLLATGLKVHTAELRKETREGKTHYYVFLTVSVLPERQFKPGKNREPENFMGIVVGESKITCVITDGKGAQVKNSRVFGETNFLQQEKLFQQKRLAMVRLAKLPETIALKAGEISEADLFRLRREILVLAHRGNALIIFEKPANGFSGKDKRKTIIALRIQEKFIKLIQQKMKAQEMPEKEWLRRVFAAYAPITCSACGFTHAGEQVKMLTAENLEAEGSLPEIISVAGRQIMVPEEFSWYFLRKNPVTMATALKYEIRKANSETQWRQAIEKRLGSKVRREALEQFFYRLLNCNLLPGIFSCRACGHTVGRDEQAAFNLVRLQLFFSAPVYKKYLKELESWRRSGGEKPSFLSAWQNFYEDQLKKGWQPLLVKESENEEI